jgi:hypothetical protein
MSARSRLGRLTDCLHTRVFFPMLA